jgi:hypothetical protein
MGKPGDEYGFTTRPGAKVMGGPGYMSRPTTKIDRFCGLQKRSSQELIAENTIS